MPERATARVGDDADASNNFRKEEDLTMRPIAVLLPEDPPGSIAARVEIATSSDTADASLLDVITDVVGQSVAVLGKTNSNVSETAGLVLSVTPAAVPGPAHEIGRTCILDGYDVTGSVSIQPNGACDGVARHAGGRSTGDFEDAQDGNEGMRAAELTREAYDETDMPIEASLSVNLKGLSAGEADGKEPGDRGGELVLRGPDAVDGLIAGEDIAVVSGTVAPSLLLAREPSPNPATPSASTIETSPPSTRMPAPQLILHATRPIWKKGLPLLKEYVRIDGL
ncbi:hypothetical protein BDK51DRAFT_46718 [Blyttiomyces helicus]|uniref:Uncharacterized protein n=1 Tax=Blyttiomyces helicus TaxID=388810 RepID=A0A4V1IRJ2_9FUNG|nr:hypothetical protein BDK51DRAFT_46718 [Blyttiomyces helicus]|eukprot:RKO90247.1 hypothetical protein BDK51DRAFT_46718 [Blyttiomyces helicus]